MTLWKDFKSLDQLARRVYTACWREEACRACRDPLVVDDGQFTPAIGRLVMLLILVAVLQLCSLPVLT